MKIKIAPSPRPDTEKLKKIIASRQEARHRARRAYEKEAQRIGLYDEDDPGTYESFEDTFGYTPGDQ